MWGKRQAEALGAKCRRCPLRPAPLVMPPIPSRKALLGVVGEGPGSKEVTFGSFFVGPSGDFFDDCLFEANFPRDLCHVTNATLCYPAGYDDEVKAQARVCCRPRLVRELKKLRTRTLLAYGKEAQKSLTGKQVLPDWVGAPLDGIEGLEKFQVISTYHPAHVVRPDGSDLRPIVFVHTARACRLAEKKLPKWRWPKRIIQPNEAALRQLEKWYDEKPEWLAYDVENIPTKNVLMAVGFGNAKDGAVSVPWHGYASARFSQKPLDQYPLGSKIQRLVRLLLEEAQIGKVLHNAAHDILCSEREDMRTAGRIYDTLVAHSLVLPGVPHDLGFACAGEMHMPRWKSIFGASAANEKGADKFIKQNPVVLRDYNGKDCIGTDLLRIHMDWQIDRMPNGQELLQKKLALLPAAVDMERDGFRRDRERMRHHQELLKRSARAALQQVQDVALYCNMEEFNPRSSPQMHELFFRRLGVKPRRFSKITGDPSLDERALTDLIGHENDIVHALSVAVLRFRKKEALYKFVDEKDLTNDDRLHAQQKYWAARTFRHSTSPQLHNIPKPLIAKRKRDRKPYVKQAGLRDTFIPDEDGHWIVCADYDQIELKILACLASDHNLLEIFAKGGDPHAAAAADLFGCKISEVTKNERDMAKIAQYEIWYGGSEETLWKHIVVEFPGFTLRQAIKAHQAYKALHPVDEYHDESVANAERDKALIAPLSQHHMLIYGQVEPNKCYNHRVQHTAADLLDEAIPKIRKAFKGKERLKTPVHDELVVSTSRPVSTVKKLIKCMTKTVVINGHRMKFTAGVKMGPSWGECIEVKNETLEQAVKRIQKVYPERLKAA
jgi:uracil-DNA glycosylase family 4